MKKLLMAGLVALAPSASMAADVSEGITLTLVQSEICDFGTWKSSEGTVGTSDIVFTSNNDGTFTSAGASSVAADAMCNKGPVSVTVLSAKGAIEHNDKTAGTGFDDSLPYTVSGSWGTHNFGSIESETIVANAAFAVEKQDPIDATLTITVTPDSSEGFLISGTYSDTLTVTLTNLL
jgi:hypothetical protein